MPSESLTVPARFDSPSIHTTPAWPQTLAIADFDGDGDRDILVFGNTALQLFVNSGTGSFTARPVQSGLWPGPSHDGTASDLDGDGDLDLTIAISGFGPDGELDGTGRIGALLNGGNGTFGPAAKDGDVDLAVANRLASKVGVLKNAGNGTYGATVMYEVAGRNLDVLMVDADQDGFLDLASANLYSKTLSLLINRGDGTFAPEVRFSPGIMPVNLAAADFDGDQFPDIAVAGLDQSSVMILHNNGGGFDPGIAIPAVQTASTPTRPRARGRSSTRSASRSPGARRYSNQVMVSFKR